ncbi:MAG: hypothetical protein A2Y80_01230 [Deltaproteobacteria bacterium RBG_13_58_19]|nr:MAG: hypothetical protein A2Y80_01230 [Deltaproteobacteria bacterium RBG_13_58_19]
MQPPNLENLTIPGGIKLNFDVGTGMRDLGEIVADSLEIDPKSTEYTFESQRSGKLRPAKVFSIKEEVSMKFKLVEPVIDNLRPFLKGGAITVVGEGTAAAVDEKITLNGELPASVDKYGISAVTVRQFLDKCFLKDHSAADAFVDNSLEADSPAGSPFSTLEEAADELYLGKATPFKEVYFDFATPGVYGGVVVKYWNGTAWTAVTGLGGAAAELDADGKMSWDLPVAWAPTLVNGYTGYFIQITATTPWSTPATVNCIRQNAVRNTDYIIDPGQVAGGLLSGRIGRLAAGFLVDGEEVKVSYTYTTWSSLKFPVAAAGFQQGAARLDFAPSTGLPGMYHVWKCQLKPDGTLAFNPSKELQLGMILEVLDDYENHPDTPFGEWEYPNES